MLVATPSTPFKLRFETRNSALSVSLRIRQCRASLRLSTAAKVLVWLHGISLYLVVHWPDNSRWPEAHGCFPDLPDQLLAGFAIDLAVGATVRLDSLHWKVLGYACCLAFDVAAGVCNCIVVSRRGLGSRRYISQALWTPAWIALHTLLPLFIRLCYPPPKGCPHLYGRSSTSSRMTSKPACAHIRQQEWARKQWWTNCEPNIHPRLGGSRSRV